MGWKMASPTDGTDLEASLLSFEKLDRASPDLWPEQLPGVAEFAASFKSPITSSPPKWMAEIERDDIDMLKELGSLTTANLMEKAMLQAGLMLFGLKVPSWQLTCVATLPESVSKFVTAWQRVKIAVSGVLRFLTSLVICPFIHSPIHSLFTHSENVGVTTHLFLV
ncbi:protein lin-52 homolog isoform X1 [Mus caroli]|uniref:Protein lin-52 homolog n=1 Tax=Mus caroli TaxID=10089 RepID=A0A6P7RWV0_MUSCR|nr:protein lin-52 homolog isoform X1 [Mus caroli]